MPVIDGLSLAIDVDAVLRVQGADPGDIRRRNPGLMQVAQRALDEALPLLKPRVLYQRLPVGGLRHEQLDLPHGKRLHGALLAQHLAGADEVVLVLCTIGETLEKHASEIWKNDTVYSLALDGAGSASVEALANAVCASFEREAKEVGRRTSIPLSPGMVGWPIEEGQPQIFAILDPSEIDVRLTPSLLMIPRKSLTLVLGVGAKVIQSQRTCDYCSLKDTCRYQDHYA
jgi:hypothetical protein